MLYVMGGASAGVGFIVVGKLKAYDGEDRFKTSAIESFGVLLLTGSAFFAGVYSKLGPQDIKNLYNQYLAKAKVSLLGAVGAVEKFVFEIPLIGTVFSFVKTGQDYGAIGLTITGLSVWSGYSSERKSKRQMISGAAVLFGLTVAGWSLNRMSATSSIVAKVVDEMPLEEVKAPPIIAGNEFLGPEALPTKRLDDQGVDLGSLFLEQGVLKLQNVYLSSKSWEQIERLAPCCLELKDCAGVNADGLVILGKNEGIKELHITGCDDCTGEGLGHLAKCEALEKIALESLPEFKEEYLKELAKLENLRDLTLSHLPIKGQGLYGLKGCTSLDYLKLEHLDLNRGVLHNEPFPSSLKGLRFRALQINDEDFQCLQDLEVKELQLIEIKGVTPEGYSGIGGLKELNQLLLVDCEGVDGSIVPVIEECKQLQWVGMVYRKEKIPDQVVSDLQKKGIEVSSLVIDPKLSLEVGVWKQLIGFMRSPLGSPFELE